MNDFSFFADPVGYLVRWFPEFLSGLGLAPETTKIIGIIVGALILSVLPLMVTLGLIWLERKLIGRVQDRIGPNRLGPFGIIQTLADMLKIFIKEHITPTGVDKVAYNLAPVLAVGAVLMSWAVIPFSSTVVGVDFEVGLIYLIAIGAIGELGILMAGWSSNNKYALISAFRTAGQLISYEVPLVLSFLVPVMLSGSLNLQEIVRSQNVWFVVLSPVAAFVAFVSMIAENARAPFDIAEADSELVAGFNIEYSGLKFGMFYVGDFLHALTLALIFSTLFLGGWRGPGAETIPVLGFIYLLLKTAVIYFLGILIRSSVPRFRIDQIMAINWKMLLPLSLFTLVMTSLVYKVLEPSGVVIQSLVLFIINVVVLIIFNQIVQRILAQKSRPEVGSRTRPIARPENTFTHSGTGA